MSQYTYPAKGVIPNPEDLCMSHWPKAGDLVEWKDPKSKKTLRGRVEICDPHRMLVFLFDRSFIGHHKWVGYGENIAIKRSLPPLEGEEGFHQIEAALSEIAVAAFDAGPHMTKDGVMEISYPPRGLK
jgi:hypothetical protein